jgi:hypothetical protein
VPTTLTSRCADGTFNCCSNDYKLIGIGVFSINHDGTKRFHPLVYALAQGEIELVALIVLHHMKEASKDIVGLTPRFKGGLISDHTKVFTNAFHNIFPTDMLHALAMFPTHNLKVPYYRYLSGNNPAKWLHVRLQRMMCIYSMNAIQMPCLKR